MKIHRIEGKLPAGATLCVHAHATSHGDTFGLKQIEHFLDSISRYSSNTPITFTLDVPDGTEQETAKVLRAMADELMGGKS